MDTQLKIIGLLQKTIAIDQNMFSKYYIGKANYIGYLINKCPW